MSLVHAGYYPGRIVTQLVSAECLTSVSNQELYINELNSYYKGIIRSPDFTAIFIARQHTVTR